MRGEVISDKQQEFNGKKYYLCGFYYQHKGERLHRTVWESEYGEIPAGHHVHHIDGDRANNDIRNLQLVEAREHCSHHSSEDGRKAISRKHIKKAIKAAAKWHGSEAGRDWHSERGKENWKMREEKAYTCTCCGKEFMTKHVYSEKSNRFCHPNCKAAFRRRRIKNGEIEK